GTELTYTLTATNAGPSDAPSVSVTDTVPAGTTFVRVAQGNCDGTISCTVGALPAGASATLVLVVRANASDAPGAIITNTARVFNTPAIDPFPANNDASATATVGPRVADLGVANTGATATDAGGATVVAGGLITYTITATNT